jgi:choline-sulfatase
MRKLFTRKAKPNLLLVMTDQQRADALGCAGGAVETPNMDRIAAEGVRFDNAYTNAPLCVPARTSLATGRYPHTTGVWRNGQYKLKPETPTWTRAVKDAGYRTSVFGKTHLHPHKGDLRDREDLLHAWGLDDVDEIAGPRAAARSRSHMVERWKEAGVYEAYREDLRERREKPWMVRPSPVPLELYADVYVGRQATAWLRAYDEPQPWLCWVSFGGPHEPWDTPEPYAGRYEPAAMPPPLAFEDAGHDRPRGWLDERLDKDTVPFEPGDVERMRADYAGGVTLIDDQLGEVLRAVEERGEWDDTVIALVSDHGEHNGDFGLISKQTFLDPAARIPFLLRVPGGVRGVVSDTMVELMDLGATFVELAGGRPVPGSHARSLVPVATGRADEHRDLALSELREEAMVVSQDYKLAVNPAGEPYLLFDRRADPQERRNLAGRRRVRDVQLDLQRRLRELVSSTP